MLPIQKKPAILLALLLIFFHTFSQPISGLQKSGLPIAIFDSGTGGLTVLEAMLTMDQFNNASGLPGPDGHPDFEGEKYQYLADQANMPYGNYAAENKTDLLKEQILKNMTFFFGAHYAEKKEGLWQQQIKPVVKMIVIACNTATAYALPDIKSFVKVQLGNHFPVIGVIEAGSKAAIKYQQKHNGTIGIFATAGTVASGGYPITLQAMATQYGLNHLSIVSQGGVGLAESIDRDWSYFADTASVTRADYKGPSLKNKALAIDTSLLKIYQFNQKFNSLLCEYDSTGSCTDIQLNDPTNYVRFHLVTLLEKMRKDKVSLPLNTLILGCTHYPYMKDTIKKVLEELYNYHQGSHYRYRNYLAEKVALIDPAMETAQEAYLAMRQQQLQVSVSEPSVLAHQFYISVPNSSLSEVSLQPDGWFSYAYKYGRIAGQNKLYVQYVPFDKANVPTATYHRFQLALPNVYTQLSKAVGL